MKAVKFSALMRLWDAAEQRRMPRPAIDSQEMLLTSVHDRAL